MIKESLNDSYCDVSGRGGDLTLLGMCEKKVLSADN